MYIYSHNDNKKTNKPKTFLVVILTIFITTVVIENIIILMNNERENYLVQRIGATGNYYPNYNNTQQKGARVSNISSIVERAKESIVGISLLTPTGESMLDVNVAKKWGMGTGIIVSRNGYILTNQHLAQNVGARLVVTLNNGKTTQGKIVWNEPVIDLAIIKINEKNLTPIEIGNSANVYVGDDVIAIGNPLGIEFQGTVTKGIISGTNRTLMFEENGKKVFMEDLIQTDASINQGNSGGPLLNTEGEVIGINTVKLSDAEGIGFAVPINVVKPVIEKFEKEDKFIEATLGIYAHDKEVIPYMNSSLILDKGIYITSVDNYGPSGKAGIKVGDVIISIDENELYRMTELREYIYSKNPTDEVNLKILSDGVEKELKVTLGKK